MNSIYIGIVSGFIAVILYTIISSKISHKKTNGQLKFGFLIAGLFWCCLTFTLGCIYGLLFTEYNFERDLYPLIGLIAGFGMGTVYTFGEAFKVYGRFDECSIQFHTPWTGSKDELWVNLQQVKFSAIANWYTLTFDSGAKIRLSALLSGHGLVIDHIKSLGHEL